jgi:hypothetical protein
MTHWNQISENILCNSEYYAEIQKDASNNLYTNLVNQRLYCKNHIKKYNSFFQNYLDIYIGNSLGKNIDYELNRRNLIISYNDNNISSGVYSNITYRYTYDYIYAGNVSLLNKGDIFIDVGDKECRIINIDVSTNIIKLRTPSENLFHFSFHEPYYITDRQNKWGGLFHMKIDRMRVNNTSIIEQIPLNYRPFIVPHVKNSVYTNSSNNIIMDVSNAFAKFEDFDSGVFDGYYTTKNKRILTNELQVYLLRNNSPNGKKLVDTIVFKNPVNGKRKTSYINDVIAPIYNHIVIEVLDPLLHALQTQPPLAHKITTTIQDINNPAKVKYCSLGRYSDVDIQDEHGFTTTVLHGVHVKIKKRAKRKIDDGCIPEKNDESQIRKML